MEFWGKYRLPKIEYSGEGIEDRGVVKHTDEHIVNVRPSARCALSTEGRSM